MRRTLQLNDCLISRTGSRCQDTALVTVIALEEGRALLPHGSSRSSWAKPSALSPQQRPCDHLAITALYQGWFRKAISKFIFPEARSLITWLEHSPAFQPEMPAKQPPPRAGMNRNRPSWQHVCICNCWSPAIIPPLSRQDQHRNDAHKIKALHCFSEFMVLFLKPWIKLSGLGSIIARSYVLFHGERNNLFINFKI